MIKGAFLQEEIIILNTYAPNIRSLKYIKNILAELKRQTAIQEDLGTLHSLLSSREIIQIENQKGYSRVKFHPRQNEPNTHLQHIPSDSCQIHIILISTWVFLLIDHMIGHKTNLNIFKMKAYQISFLTTIKKNGKPIMRKMF